jgi:NADPH:quinone reductase-like Zn-dependent oxidoreductase
MTMKAAYPDEYCGPEDLLYGDVDRPAAGDDDVLVRVRAAGVDQGVWHLVAGLPRLIRLAGFGLRRPKNRVPGMDVAGVVEAVGANVTRFRPGDEVFGTCDGSFAEFAVTTADLLAHKPANVTFEAAAAVPTSAYAALQGLSRTGRLQGGQTVAVIGAGGGVGSYAVQLAKAYGATVTGVCSTAKVDLVRSLGADDVVDYTREELTGGGRSYDLILDTGGNRPLSELRRALAPRGTLVLVGAEHGPGWGQGMDRQLRAALLTPFVRQRLRSLLSLPRAADLETLRALVAAGTVTPAVDRTFPLKDAGAAIAYLRAGRACGKVVLTV